MTKEEAREFLRDIPEYEDMEIRESRTQEQQYKEILQSCSTTDSFRLLKALYRRKRKREAAGRRITAVDEKYLYLAKDCLLNELAVALDMDVEEVETLLTDRIKSTEK